METRLQLTDDVAFILLPNDRTAIHVSKDFGDDDLRFFSLELAMTHRAAVALHDNFTNYPAAQVVH